MVCQIKSHLWSVLDRLSIVQDFSILPPCLIILLAMFYIGQRSFLPVLWVVISFCWFMIGLTFKCRALDSIEFFSFINYVDESVIDNVSVPFRAQIAPLSKGKLKPLYSQLLEYFHPFLLQVLELPAYIILYFLQSLYSESKYLVSACCLLERVNIAWCLLI